MMDITKILVLGSGMVARPCVEYLVRNSKNEVTIGELPLPLAISFDINIHSLPHLGDSPDPRIQLTPCQCPLT